MPRAALESLRVSCPDAQWRYVAGEWLADRIGDKGFDLSDSVWKAFLRELNIAINRLLGREFTDAELTKLVIAAHNSQFGSHPATAGTQADTVINRASDYDNTPENQRWEAITPRENVTVRGRWRVVELGQLVTSNMPAYDQSLQPRDRTSTESREQVARIAANPNPALLLESPTTDTGAPIVDGRLQVLSGNGRVMGLAQAYKARRDGAGGPADPYRKTVIAKAEQLGLDTQGMANPVLVRELLDSGNATLGRITELSNRPQQLARSEAELADADAKALLSSGIMSLFEPDDAGNIRATSNREFLLAFIRETGAEGMRTVEGGFSPSIVGRVQRAVLAAIFAKSDATRKEISDAIEGAEGLGIKRVLDAILVQGGNLLKLAETKPRLDITPELGAALLDYIRYRKELADDRVRSLTEYLGQIDLFDAAGRLSETEMLLREMDSARSAKQFRQLLETYVQLADNVDTATAPLFGTEIQETSKEELLQGAIHAQKNRTETGDLFKPRTGVSGTATGSVGAKSEEQTSPPRPGSARDTGKTKPEPVTTEFAPLDAGPMPDMTRARADVQAQYDRVRANLAEDGIPPGETQESIEISALQFFVEIPPGDTLRARRPPLTIRGEEWRPVVRDATSLEHFTVLQYLRKYQDDVGTAYSLWANLQAELLGRPKPYTFQEPEAKLTPSKTGETTKKTPAKTGTIDTGGDQDAEQRGASVRRTDVEGGAGTPGDRAPETAGTDARDEDLATVPGKTGVRGTPGHVSDEPGESADTGKPGGVSDSGTEPDTPTAGAKPRPRPRKPARVEPEGETAPGQVPDGNRPRGRTEPLNQRNHVIQPDDVIAPPGQIAKVKANIRAIRLLKKLDSENRDPTPDEQNILAQYTGWGHSGELFNVQKAAAAERRERESSRYGSSWQPYGYDANWTDKWWKLHKELRDLVTDEEWRQLSASILNAHYTSATVVRRMWDIVRRLGFRGGERAGARGGGRQFLWNDARRVGQNVATGRH